MIGIFDSGSGGLSVLHALRTTMPSADISYFGDIKHAPYGNKNRIELTQLTISAIEYLQQIGATRIVSACNSVSASLAVSLYDTLLVGSDALIEMVGPTVASFRGYSGRIIVCATEATIVSEIYQTGLRMIGCKEVEAVSFPELAGLIENGVDAALIAQNINDTLSTIVFKDGDVVVLACTHYPLVLQQFKMAIPPHVQVFDPSYAVAERAKKLWWPQEVGNGILNFYISKDSSVFRGLLATLFPNDIYKVEVIH